MSERTHADDETHAESHAGTHAGAHATPHYLTLAGQLAISALFMYLLMFLMIDTADHFHNNLNALYMTGAMVAPMGVAMILMMRSMFPRRWLNIGLLAGFVALYVVGIWFTRQQTFIDNGQFLRSMIPHHSGAILMCEQANITDTEIATLCESIIRSQSAEIAQMEAILARL
jgi:uncharacterized membrane protein